MAKGARASSHKANNQKLKANVFGPIETARTERLSAKLLELASQPKLKPAKEDIDMEAEGTAEDANANPTSIAKDTEDMEVDQDAKKSASKLSKGRIEKKVRHKSSRKASIVFPKYKEGKRVGKAKGNSRRINGGQ